MQDDKEEPKRWHERATEVIRRHAGTAVFVVTAGVLAFGWLSTDLTGARPYLTLAFPPLIGAFSGICVVRKWKAWLAALVIGMAIGLVSALQLYLGPTFAGQYRVGFLTVVFYAVLGAIFGAVAELIRFLHRISHDFAEKKLGPKAGK